MKKNQKPHPDFHEEQNLWDRGFDYVIGIDEVGRGAFAGPLVAAGVIYPKHILPSSFFSEINDSKLLTSKLREKLCPLIQEKAFKTSISAISVPTINAIGVGKATFKAFKNVIKELQQTIHNSRVFILIDGFLIPNLEELGLSHQKAIIHGDQKSVSIASASIIAKVFRDNLMADLHLKYPQYNFLENKGYGTKDHREAISKHKLCDLHRTSFNLQKFL